MDDKARQALQDELAELDRAAISIRTARVPFDSALSAIETVKENLLNRHSVEIAGNCEGCGQLLFVGDQGFRCDEGEILCAQCSPTFGDAEQNWKNHPEDEDADRKKAFMESLAAHLAAGGVRTDKLPLYEL